MSFRRDFERRVGPFVVLVARLPKWLPFLVVGLLLVGGLLAQGTVGAVLLLVLTALLGALLLLSWPALQPPPRALRALVLAILLARAVSFLA